jgi:hypothetical protein
MAQIITQLFVFLLELGHPQLNLRRFRQRLLGGGIGAAVRESGWLAGLSAFGCRSK